MSAPVNAAPGYVQLPPQQSSAPRVSFLSSIEVITDPVSRWEGGFMYDSTLSYYPLQQREICDPTAHNVFAGVSCAPVQADTFVITAGEKTSTFNKNSRDLYARTLNALTSYETFYIEMSFVLNQFPSAQYPSLFNPTNTFSTESAAAKSVIDAFASVENQIIGWALNGLRATMYVSQRVMAYLNQNRLVRREGNLWLSPIDTIVIPMTPWGMNPNSYPVGFTPPAADQEYIWASTGPTLRRSEVMFFPEREAPSEGNPYGYPAAAINRQNNEIIVYAERIYGLSFTCNSDYPVIYALADFTL